MCILGIITNMPKWHAGLIELKSTLSEQLNLTEMDYDDRNGAKVEPDDEPRWEDDEEAISTWNFAAAAQRWGK